MTRYVTRREATPKADNFWDDRMMQPLAHPQVFEETPVRTGLLDRDGRAIYRLPDKLGFLPDRQK